MTRSRIRTTGPLGTAVVATFLLGFLSAPLRPCFSHQGHDHHGAVGGGATPAHEAGAREAHAGHDARYADHHDALAPAAPGDDRTPSGCECLGHCQLETSPFLPLGTALAQAVAPAPDAASLRNVGDAPVAGSPHAVPLARGPPPLA